MCSSDLTGYRGGLRLPHIKITNLSRIPTGSSAGVFSEALSTEDEAALEGIIVYNTNTEDENIPKGVYCWDGAAWALVSGGNGGSGGDGGDDGGSGSGGTVIVTPPTTTLGNGYWSGKRCFNYIDFANAAGAAGESLRTYNFKVTGGNIRNLSFSYLTSSLITSISTTTTIPTGEIANGSSFDVVIKFGSTPTSGNHTMQLYANYLSGETMYQVPLEINVQAQNCCGVSVDMDDDGSKEFVEFMCHNLGASSETEAGSYYQWGSNSTSWVSGANAPNNAWMDSEKTGLDPCPVGWRVPTEAVWRKVITVPNTWDGGKKGRNFDNTLFLPAAGWKSTASAALVGTVGYYWSSTPSTSPYSWYLAFDSGGIGMNNLDRYVGMSVRCVEE